MAVPTTTIPDYEMADPVEVIDPPRAIAWRPGQGPDQRQPVRARLEFSRWILKINLDPRFRPHAGDTDLRLVGAAAHARHRVSPLNMARLDNSLKNLAGLAERRIVS